MVRKRVIFARLPEVNSVEREGDVVELESTSMDRGLEFGRFKYEKEAVIGSSCLKDSGEYLFDSERSLIAVESETDSPKTVTVLRDIAQLCETELVAPTYPVEASHDFYRTYGFNGYTTEFCGGLHSFDVTESITVRKDPEEIAKERAMCGFETMSDDLVDKVVNELIEEGLYIHYMDVQLDNSLYNFTFSNPIKFGSIKQDEWSQELFALLHERAIELIDNNVKTVEEVLSSSG